MSERSDSPEKSEDINIHDKTIEALIVRLIPTSQYFEARFNNLEQKFDYKFEVMNGKVDQLARSHESLKLDMDQRFVRVDEQFKGVRSDMDQRFKEVRSDMDQRFKEFRLDIDKRFEQVDQRFEQVDAKLDKIIDKIDRRIEDGLRENRSQSFRLFSFAMTFSAISMIGMLGRLFNLF